MIGDKVYETLLEDTPQVVTVEEIGQRHIYIGTADDIELLRYEPKYLGWDIKHIEPIPLTAKILELNGFECRDTECDSYYCLFPDDYTVTVKNFNELMITFNHSNHGKGLPKYMLSLPFNVSCVHKFQQVLRLVGLVSLANQFKV